MVGREAGVSLLWPELTLGWRRAARGPLLVALAAVLAFCLLALPGRADAGLVRTGYGVVLAWMVLIVSALWCGGTAYALDRERHRLTLTFTKPVRRWALWWGRLAGVLAPFAALTVILWVALAFRAIPEGRTVMRPALPDLDAAARAELARLRAVGRVPVGVPEARLLRAVRDHLEVAYTELRPGEPRIYHFLPVAKAGAATFRLSGAPFLGARDALALRVTAACAGKTLTFRPTELRDTGFAQPLPADFVVPGQAVTVTLERLDTREACSVIYRERADVALLLPGQAPLLNLAYFCLALFLTVAMAAALGCALGCAFSLPVTLFTGTVALLAATAAALSPPTSVSEEMVNWWTRLSAVVSWAVARPFQALVALNPLARLLGGEAIEPVAFLRAAVAAIPWCLLCSAVAVISPVADEDK